VSLDKFESNIRSYLDRCESSKTAVLYAQIAIGGDSEYNTPLIADQVAKYNDVLDQLAREYSFLKVLPVSNAGENFLEDGHHLNELGNHCLAQSASALLS